MRSDVKAMMERELAKSRRLIDVGMRPDAHSDVQNLAHALLSLSYIVETLLNESPVEERTRPAPPQHCEDDGADCECASCVLSRIFAKRTSEEQGSPEGR